MGPICPKRELHGGVQPMIAHRGHGRLQRGPISPMNEVQTLGLLTKMIKSLANRKSVEKDEAALQDPASAQMSTNRRLALLYRLRQQKGLELALARLREMKGRVAL